MRLVSVLMTAFIVPRAAVAVGAAEPAPMPKVGDSAPAVAATTQDGATWRLADARGQRAVLLYFYPKDDTPGCTKQACGLRDRVEDFKRDGIEVVGVSFDTAQSHKAFAEKHQLNFKLLADTDGQVADAFGVRVAPGRKMARRVSFLIDRDGRIVHLTDSPDPAVHLAQIKAAVEKLKK